MELSDAQQLDKTNKDTGFARQGSVPHSADGESGEKVVVTSERFWILLQFGLSTMINAVGWISLAPVYALVEDVSTLEARLSYLVLTLAAWLTSCTTWAR